MTPDTLNIDLIFPGVGRINRRSGTLDKKVVTNIKKAARATYRAGRLDVLRAVRDRHVTWLEFYDAYQRNTLETLPVGHTVALLEPTMRAWIDSTTGRYSDKHVTSLGTSLGYLAAKPGARVADLPEILEQLQQGALGIVHPRSFNLARAAAMRFVRSTLKRNHPLYLACAAVEVLPEPAPKVRPPITLTRMRDLFPAPQTDALDAIAWTMATTGMHAEEYWGVWEQRADRVHIHGTKAKGRVRDVPLVRPPDRPRLSRDRFEKVFRRRFAGVITPYQLRRTYVQWLEEAGVPRTRRQLYMGHGAQDVTDLYERHQVEEFLAGDAKKLKAYLKPPKKKAAKPVRRIKLA